MFRKLCPRSVIFFFIEIALTINYIFRTFEYPEGDRRTSDEQARYSAVNDIVTRHPRVAFAFGYCRVSARWSTAARATTVSARRLSRRILRYEYTLIHTRIRRSDEESTGPSKMVSL